MIDGVAAAAHTADGLAAHDARANGVHAVGLDVLHLGKMDAVFVAKGQVAEQVFERVDAALREEFSALGTDAFDHADFGAEVHRHWCAYGVHWTHPLYIIPAGNIKKRQNLRLWRPYL